MPEQRKPPNKITVRWAAWIANKRLKFRLPTGLLVPAYIA